MFIQIRNDLLSSDAIIGIFLPETEKDPKRYSFIVVLTEDARDGVGDNRTYVYDTKDERDMDLARIKRTLIGNA